jgi:gluconokinase
MLTFTVSQTKPERQPPGRLLNRVLIVAGPAGTGKSTLASQLASVYQVPFIEGDEYHPVANVNKMSSGIALTSTDRELWLTALWERIRQLEFGGVVSCSALDVRTRSWLRDHAAAYDVGLHFVFLVAEEKTLMQRVMGRQGHYMKACMVSGQYSIMQIPTAEEGSADVIATDEQSAEMVLKTTLRTLEMRNDLWE